MMYKFSIIFCAQIYLWEIYIPFSNYDRYFIAFVPFST